MALWKRVYGHDKFLPYLGLFVVFTFVVAAAALSGTVAQAQQRERDRVSADVASCNRGNLLRGQVIEIGKADQVMIESILDVVLPANRDQRAADMRSQLEPILAEYAEAVDQISLVDCQAVTPGGTRTPEGKP